MSILALTAIAFLYQILRLDELQADWNGMKEKVASVERVGGKISEFRPWHSSFPETGEIWLKQLNIRDVSKDMNIKDASKVMATGSSRDQTSLLATLDKLRITSGISNLELKSQQGTDPIFFSFEFDWDPAGISTSAQ